MIKHLERIGLTAEALDNVVDEAASSMASNANNDGISGQINFLTVMGGYSEAVILSEAIRVALQPGMTVDVSDPQHDDSPHKHAFTGTVELVSDHNVEVTDMDDDCWHIEFDEIEFIHSETEAEAD